jgi:LysM repeat protein
MVDRSRGRRSAARYLVPFALAATIASTVLIVEHGLASKRVAAHTSRPAALHGGVRQTANRPRRRVSATSYTVRAGDTLGVVAGRFGISVAQIEAFNPKLNPNALQVGQQIRLRR